jgi:drug/metabolite transporter (DMT)-like permease
LNGSVVLYSLIMLMVTLWASNFIVGKVALQEFPAILLGSLRIIFAGMFLAPIYWLKKPSVPPTHPMWKDVPLLMALAFFNTGNQIAFVAGLSLTSVAHSALLIGLSPILVLLIAAAVKQERITGMKVAGMGIALAGVALLVSQARGQPGGATLLGDALVFVAALGFAAFTVLGKRATARHSSLAVNAFAFIGSALALVPFVWWRFRTFAFDRVTAAGWSSVIYMAVFPSVVCYLIYYYALTRVPASRVSAFSYLQPPLAAAMGVLFLGEHITTPLVAGGTVIFTGVVLTERG